MKKLLSFSAIFLAGCASTSTVESKGVESFPKIISQLQARYCELDTDDKRRVTADIIKDYDGWNEFTKDVADTAALCMWGKQPDFESGCNER